MKIRICSIVLVLSFLISGCGNKKSTGDENRPVIYVSILPLQYMVQQIAGNNFRVEVLVPPGEIPETFSPSTKKITEMAGAVAYFKIGSLGFETTWMDKIEASNPNMDIFTTSLGVEMIKGQIVQHGDHTHDNGIDPHIWLSTQEAFLIANNIFEGLLMIDPGNENYYANNLTKFEKRIEEVKSTIEEKLTSCKGKSFFIYHPSLSYFAREFELIQYAIEEEGKEPSPKHLKKLVDQAKTDNIQSILVQKEFDRSNAKTLAREIDAKIKTIHPLDYQWDEQLIHIATLIEESYQ